MKIEDLPTSAWIRPRLLPFEPGRAEAPAATPVRQRAHLRGLTLTEMRESTGFTQVQLSLEMGISQARISKIEHGEVGSIEVVESYVRALGGSLLLLAGIGGRLWRLD